jgi:DNA polymerase I-like protein with 3'-5' exonuclease and polymerase domains
MKNLMKDAYNRELRLLPIIMDMEHKGVCISKEIFNIQKKWASKFSEINRILHNAVPIEPGTKAWFNAARKKGIIDESKLQYTAKGNPRYAREFIEELVSDATIKEALSLRSKLQKALGTYINVYADSALKYDYHFYPYFQQTRGDNEYGTRTGRMSSNLQQLPRTNANDDIKKGKMPNLRALIVPDEGEILIKRDFNAQEIRVTAHYAGGSVLEAYINNPRMDVHQFVTDLIRNKTGMSVSRVITKWISFLKLYGGGPSRLALILSISDDQARQFFAAYDAAFPEFKQLMREIEQISKKGGKIRTWGGRLYAPENPKMMNGQLRQMFYKQGNVLIQGSSADMTKEAMIRYYNNADRKGRIILVVHDEIVVSVSHNYVDHEMKILKQSMNEIPGWDVPLESDGSIGNNFGEMEKYND